MVPKKEQREQTDKKKKTMKNVTAFGWQKNNVSLKTAHFSWRKIVG